MLVAASLALAFHLAFGQKAPQQTRLRTILPSGEVVLVERIPNAKTLSVHLFAGSKGIEETPETNGYRHLLEHLVAAGIDDAGLEREGGFLRARTLRDATDFEVSISPNKLKVALAALAPILKKSTISQAAIDSEIPILREEGALRDEPAKMSELAWKQAFGETGGDPFGNLEVMGQAKASEMERLLSKTFIAQNLALVIAGDVDLDLATEAATDFFHWVPTGTAPAAHLRHASGSGSVQTELSGCAIAVPVPGYRNPRCAAVLSAALALSSDLADGFVTYTPSSEEGLVILGQRQGSDLFQHVKAADADRIFPLARIFARRWVERQLAGAEAAAYWRGLLLIQERDLRPETLEENIEAMTPAQFASALASFSSAKAVRVVGH